MAVSVGMVTVLQCSGMVLTTTTVLQCCYDREMELPFGERFGQGFKSLAASQRMADVMYGMKKAGSGSLFMPYE